MYMELGGVPPVVVNSHAVNVYYLKLYAHHIGGGSGAASTARAVPSLH